MSRTDWGALGILLIIFALCWSAGWTFAAVLALVGTFFCFDSDPRGV